MSVRRALEEILETSEAPLIFAEIARSLADQIDEGKGVSAASKELRLLMVDLIGDVVEDDVLDELARKRAARRAV